MELSYQAMLTKGHPAEIHVASIIASRQAVEHIAETLPEDKTTIWCAAIDPEINEHSYIVPGLGDAGGIRRKGIATNKKFPQSTLTTLTLGIDQ